MFPGIAVAEKLVRKDPDCRIVFAGSERAVDREILSGVGFEFHALPAPASRDLLRHPFRFFRAFRRARRAALDLLDQLRPEVVVGLGGFASVALGAAAGKPGVRLVLLEQNCVAGRATRWLSRRAETVCISFPETWVGSSKPRVVLTGNPVRESIAASRDVPPGKTLLITGGSQGATRLNDMVMKTLRDPSPLPAGWEVVHQTGSVDVDRVADHYREAGISARVQPYLSDMAAEYASAGLVISRAGGTSLAELACIGRATILVPYPRSVMEHQKRNALCFAEANAAAMVEHGPDSVRELRGHLNRLLANDEERDRIGRAMKLLGSPEAAQAVADLIVPESA